MTQRRTKIGGEHIALQKQLVSRYCARKMVSCRKVVQNVAWFNQGWTRTRGSISCQPTLGRVCGRVPPFLRSHHLLLSPNRFSKFGLELDSDSGTTILFENNTFFARRRRSQRICLLCISRCPSAAELKSRAIPI